MKNRKRLNCEILPLLQSFYDDHWRIKYAILNSSDLAFNVVANLEQMQAHLSRIIELAKKIEEA